MNVTTGAVGVTYEMMSAEVLFWKAFRLYVQRTDDTSIEERVNDLVAELVSKRNLNLIQSAAARVEIRSRMTDHRYWFDKQRTSFLILDRFPENADRFPLTYDDLLKLPVTDE